MNKEEARKLLTIAGVFYDDLDEDEKDLEQAINLNDAFYWSCSDCEHVSDEELVEVARLFRTYGMCGIYYWVFKKRGWDKVEFVDINRFVEFVANEERIIVEEPDWDKRGYYKATYTIGEK